jgi:hypothetical protein
VFFIAALVRFIIGSATVDDAYITFRYARNIAEGFGFVYNLGEHVLGTTTPFFALLMALLYRLGFRDLPTTALTISAIADGITAGLLVMMGRRLHFGDYWSILLGLLFAFLGISIAFAIGGMESSVFTMLVVLAVSAFMLQKFWWAGLFAGLATFTRPDGIILALLFLIAFFVQHRRPNRNIVFGYLVSTIPWLIFATWWFGNPIPQSIIAKSDVYKVPLVENSLNILYWLGPLGVIALIFALANVRVAPKVMRQYPDFLPLLLFAPLLLCAYIVAACKGGRLFAWYAVPFTPFVLLASLFLFRKLCARMSVVINILIGVVLFGLTLSGLNLGRNPQQSFLYPTVLNVTRERAYADAGRFLAPRLDPDSLVALPEIGVFGYVTNARLLDLLGLVSPESTPFYPLPNHQSADNAVSSELIQQSKPTYLVSLDQFLQPELVTSDWFCRDYQLVASFDARIWASTTVVVYQRNGLR